MSKTKQNVRIPKSYLNAEPLHRNVSILAPGAGGLAVLASELCNGGTLHGWSIRSRDKRKARSAGLSMIIGWAQLVKVKVGDGRTIHKSLEQEQEFTIFRLNVFMIRYIIVYTYANFVLSALHKV